MIISLFIPHGGCPERCHFCSQKISGGTPTPIRKIVDTLNKHWDTAPNTDFQIAIYGGTFTGLGQALQLTYLDAIQDAVMARFGSTRPSLYKGLRVSTRPDALEESWIQKLVEDYHLRTLELGIQSWNSSVVQALGRTFNLESLYRLHPILRKLPIELVYHFMVGAPGEFAWLEELKIFETGLKQLPCDGVRIHPLVVLEHTELAHLYALGKWAPLDLDLAVERCADLFDVCQKLEISVIRLGLQANELLGSIPGQSSVLAGPYHPAFGELVMSRIYRRKIEQILVNTMKLERHSEGILSIQGSPQVRSQILGLRKQNLLYFQNRFPSAKIGFHSFNESRELTIHYEINQSATSSPQTVRIPYVSRFT